jgi:hypothetical protein
MIRLLSSKDFWLSLAFFLVMFVGNARAIGFPLIVFLISLLLIFYSSLRASILEFALLIFSSFLFVVYAIYANIQYDYLYPFWVVSFFLGFLFSKAISERFNADPGRMLQIMAYTYLPILVIFLVGITYLSADPRASFVFGPNMLYRIIGFLIAIIAGYFLYQRQILTGTFIILVGIFALTATGSRASSFSICILLILYIHILVHKIRKYHFFSSIILIAPLLALVDLSDLRVFNFSDFFLQDSSFSDAYVRFRPYIYLIYEPDRMSLVGIQHIDFLELFATPGFIYPHNIVLELLMFYGFFGITVSLIVLYRFFYVVIFCIRNLMSPLLIFLYSYMLASLGMMFSGDLGDNGALIGILFGLSFSNLRHNLNNEKFKNYV